MPARATGSRSRATSAGATSSTGPFSPSARPTPSRTNATSLRCEKAAETGRVSADRESLMRLRTSLFDRGDNLAGGIYGTILVTSHRGGGGRLGGDLALARDRRGDGDRVLARARVRPRAGLAARQQRGVLAGGLGPDRRRRVAAPAGRCRSLDRTPRRGSRPHLGAGGVLDRDRLRRRRADLVGLHLRAQGADVRARDDRRRASSTHRSGSASSC